MHLLSWLQDEIATTDGGERPWKATIISFHDAILPILDEAWAAVKVRGWKGDWVRAAKHVFLGQVTDTYVTHSPQIGATHLGMVTRWLRGLQPTWTSEEPDAPTQAIVDRKAETVALVTQTEWRTVWERAQFYFEERGQTRSRRAPCPIEKEVA